MTGRSYSGEPAGPGGPGRPGSRRARLSRRKSARRTRRIIVTAAAIVVAAAVAAAVTIFADGPAAKPHPVAWGPRHPIVIRLPAQPTSYIGAYARGVPGRYAPLTSFAASNGVQPNIALYYSGWGERFRSAFAGKAAAHHATTLVQIDPGRTRLTDIAAGYYDKYLRTFAASVGDFGARSGRGVIIGFGHEPNGYWYPWGHKHASPSAWIAAWRHIVTVFRAQGVDDVTWLWTVNVIVASQGIVSPAAWWPGASYVTWVGIDGYYHQRASTFASLFGPTIRAIRDLTRAPILVSETGVLPRAGKPAKIADVFAGVRSYGLLGLVWFNVRSWRLDTRPAASAFATAASRFGPLAG